LRNNIFFSVLILFLSISWVQAQSKQSIRDHFSFVSPVKHDYKLAGNFCELRNSHFHGGIDIRQSWTGKDTIFSIGDGFVSRIQVSAGGYGLALYVDHPETGLTSVYAHLDLFNTEIAGYVQNKQLSQESYDVDLLLSPDIFPVYKGQYLGMMGNTGFSQGKHLHFEIRETATDKVLNPFLVGFSVEDNIPPTLLRLKIHGLDDDFHKIAEKTIPLSKYRAKDVNFQSVIEIPANQAGIAIEAFDRNNGSSFKQGLYAIKLYVNDTLQYSSLMDKLPAAQTRYIKGYVDYSAKQQNQGTFTLCYRYPGNNLSLAQYGDDGIISLSPDTTQTVTLKVEDFAGNARSVTFKVRKSSNHMDTNPKSDEVQLVKVNEYTDLQIGNASLFFEPNSLFRNINCVLDTITQANKMTKYKIHDRKEPLKTPLKIAILPDMNIPDQKIAKAIIVREDAGKINCGGSWNEDGLETRITDFGVYTIGFDTIAPSIRPVSFLPKAAKFQRFRFTISDNFRLMSNGMTKALQIKVWVDGNFHLSSFDAKTHTLTIPIKDINSGKHELVIEAIDHCSNAAYFNSYFYR
jgi:murein DD-endopeptidase MepM/ murein hydrolase activator NlpD